MMPSAIATDSTRRSSINSNIPKAMRGRASEVLKKDRPANLVSFADQGAQDAAAVPEPIVRREKPIAKQPSYIRRRLDQDRLTEKFLIC
jgi:hypothetical protein